MLDKVFEALNAALAERDNEIDYLRWKVRNWKENMSRSPIKMKNGVDFYTTGHAVVTVHFPEDRTVCMWCPFCLRDARNPSRKVCIITDEPIVYEEYGRGGKCPLKFESEE